MTATSNFRSSADRWLGRRQDFRSTPARSIVHPRADAQGLRIAGRQAFNGTLRGIGIAKGGNDLPVVAGRGPALARGMTAEIARHSRVGHHGRR